MYRAKWDVLISQLLPRCIYTVFSPLVMTNENCLGVPSPPPSSFSLSPRQLLQEVRGGMEDGRSRPPSACRGAEG